MHLVLWKCICLSILQVYNPYGRYHFSILKQVRHYQSLIYLADRTHSWCCICYCKLLGQTILQPSGGMPSISEIYFGILRSASHSHFKLYLDDWTCSWVALFIANTDAKPFNNLIYTSWIYQIVFTKQQMVLMKSTQTDLGMTHAVCNSIKILLCNNLVNNKIY